MSSPNQYPVKPDMASSSDNSAVVDDTNLAAGGETLDPYRPSNCDDRDTELNDRVLQVSSPGEP